MTITWHLSSPPVYLVGSVLLIFLAFCVVLLCVFTFWVPCCDVRIKTIFGSSLPLVVCRRADVLSVLFMLFVFACVEWCPTRVVLCFCFGFFFVLCTLCCQFLWIVHFWFRICSTCRKHFPVLSPFTTYYRVCN